MRHFQALKAVSGGSALLEHDGGVELFFLGIVVQIDVPIVFFGNPLDALEPNAVACLVCLAGQELAAAPLRRRLIAGIFYGDQGNAWSFWERTERSTIFWAEFSAASTALESRFPNREVMSVNSKKEILCSRISA